MKLLPNLQLKEELDSIETEAGSMKAAAPGAVMEFLKLQAVRACFVDHLIP